MFSGEFLARGSPLLHRVQFHHGALLVVLSYLVAAFASYTAFHLIECVRTAATANARRAWLAIAGISMGLGIWAMHFIAMLAVEMPISVGYDVQVTGLSAGFAIVASWVALGLIANKRRRLFLPGIVLGMGVALMHYVGMAALRMEARIRYDPWILALSALVAVTLSTGALCAIRDLPRIMKGRRLIGSAVMGLAIALMHYTGMLATVFYPESGTPRADFFFNSSSMAVVIGVSTLMIVGLPLIAALFQNHRKQVQDFTGALIDSLPGYFALLDQGGCFTRWNTNLKTLTGLSDEQLLGLNARAIALEKDHDVLLTRIRDVFVHGFAALEFGVINQSGEIRAVHWRGRRITYEGRQYLLAIGLDMTESRASEARIQESEDRLRTIFNVVNDGIVVHDACTAAFIEVNPRICEMFGYAREELLKLDLRDLSTGVPPYVIEDIAPLLERVLSDEAVIFEWHCKARDGHRFWVEVSVLRAVFSGQAVLVSTTRDITERKHANDEIARMARQDVLTGLANRGVFVEALRQTITRVGRNGGSFAVLYLDLDHFKDVNDTLGHPVGDLLLQAVAERLGASLREVDTVARFGGDEFAVILADIQESADADIVLERMPGASSEPVAIVDSAVAAGGLAEKILKAVSEPFLIKGNEIRSGATIGVGVYGPDAPDPETVLSQTDLALYGAKSEGRGTYCFFTDAMETEVRARVRMSAELRVAIDSDQLFLMYQPQVDIDTGCIVGLETLVRWHHPTLGTMGPDKFIPAAERNGLIVPLGNWVMRAACQQIRQWLDGSIAAPMTAVNLSGVQFRSSRQLESDIAAILAESGLPAQRLELELTESVLMVASIEHNDLLLRLRKAGHRIAIDDFGSGYSSLDYLRRYPADRIKIAQTFIADIGIVPGNDAIVRAALGLARELGMEVVVEGVETAAQFELLKEWGCHIMQGYYFSRPLGVPEVTALLHIGKITHPDGRGAESPSNSDLADWHRIRIANTPSGQTHRSASGVCQLSTECIRGGIGHGSP
jgi:diguanylate cyclase (GGDEF)-like protein/PAS domain S-box-containing protein